ncbi:MAG: hypothetical protein R3C02_05670 [Planctomycetaceae bacterium]
MRLLRYSAHKSFALLACIVCSTTTTTAAELTDLVAGDVKPLMSDCKFTEGPAWHPDGVSALYGHPQQAHRACAPGWIAQ